MAGQLKGFVYATLVSAGPMIISVTMMVLIGQYLKMTDVPLGERDLVYATLMYAYIFSLISVSGISMALSRFLADQIYLGKHNHILASFTGAAASLLAVCGLGGAIFYWSSPLDPLFRFLAYLLFLELVSLYLLMVYLSAVKDYKKISLAFLAGISLALLLIVVLRPLGLPVPILVLGSVNLGFLLALSLMLMVVKRYFGQVSDRPFAFFFYIRKMPLLFAGNFLYTCGLFAHNFVFWFFSDLGISLDRTFRFAPVYDNATFYAVLTVIPAMVIFVVKAETAFFEKFRRFNEVITGGGSLASIDQARDEMLQTLQKELGSLFEIQFIVTALAVILGAGIILPALTAGGLVSGIYAILALGYFFTQMLFVLITVMLYFDAQGEAFAAALVFLGATLGLSVLSLLAGQAFYGLGFCLGAIIAFIFALARLKKITAFVDYRVFTKPAYLDLRQFTSWLDKEE